MTIQKQHSVITACLKGLVFYTGRFSNQFFRFFCCFASILQKGCGRKVFFITAHLPFLPYLPFLHPIDFHKIFPVLLSPDDHKLLKFSCFFFFKSGHLFPGAYTGPYDRNFSFLIIICFFFTFPSPKHPGSPSPAIFPVKPSFSILSLPDFA